MKQIYEIFANINRTDIDENSVCLVSDGVIDSFEIMEIVAQIDQILGFNMPYEFLVAKNFESFAAIKDMILRAKNG